jgi:site-specific DNA-methyltransferase (adenine-specific)
MKELEQNTQYRKIEKIQDFFEYNTKGDTANEKGTI